MCYRHERRVEPASREDPVRVPPSRAPNLRRPAVGVALVAGAALVAAFMLPDMLNARPERADAPRPVAAAAVQAVPVVARTTRVEDSSTATQVGGAGMSPVSADDEVPPSSSSNASYGGCHHD